MANGTATDYWDCTTSSSSSSCSSYNTTTWDNMVVNYYTLVTEATWNKCVLDYYDNCSTCATTSISMTEEAWTSVANEYFTTLREQSKEDIEKRRIALEESVRKEEERRREEEKKQANAREKARELLETVLNEEQKRSLREKEFFLVEVKSGHKYRIRTGRSGNVDRLDENGKVVEKFCIHEREFVPNYDTMTTQKLLLESDEEYFRKTANITRVAI